MKLQKILTQLPIVALLLVALGASASFAVTPEEFVNPASNYEPMNVYIKDYNYMGFIPLKDDKIGIFNEKSNGDTLCVGVFTMLKDFSEYGVNEFIRVTAFKEYKENGVVLDEGFTEGDTLKFYHLVAETNQVVPVPSANVTYLHTSTGQPLENPVLFFGRGTALVEIKTVETKLTINVSPEGAGETIPKADEYMVSKADSVITIAIDPAQTDEHHEFVNWTVDGETVETATVQVTMDDNHEVTANFAKKQYNLTTASNPVAGCEFSINPAGPTFDALQVVEISAKWIGAEAGYEFDHWQVSPATASVAEPNQASTTVTMTSDIGLVAVFVKKVKFDLWVNGEGQGDVFVTINDDDASKYKVEYGAEVNEKYLYMTSVKLEAIPKNEAEGENKFESWIIDYPDGSQEVVENDKVKTITLEHDSIRVTATFQSAPVELASFTVENGNTINGAAVLRWQTASETNNLGFDVERSIGDDKNWEKIGFLKGFGTTVDAKYYEFVDEDATTEGDYFYRLKQNDTNGAFEYSSTVQYTVSAPDEFALAQNYPNPFNPSTQIVFQLKEDIQVNLTVFDLLGREVAQVVDAEMKAGTHKITFDAKELSAGVYFYSLSAGSFHAMKKMTLIK
jgi:hypothetical protein